MPLLSHPIALLESMPSPVRVPGAFPRVGPVATGDLESTPLECPSKRDVPLAGPAKFARARPSRLARVTGRLGLVFGKPHELCRVRRLPRPPRPCLRTPSLLSCFLPSCPP